MRTHGVMRSFDEASRTALAAGLDAAPGGERVSWTDGPGLPGDAAEVRVLVGGRPSEEQLDGCPRLEAVVVPFAGLPGVLRDRLLARPHLRVHNLHHNAAPTAETAVALLLAAARRLVPADRALRAGDWRPRYEPLPAVTLAGRRACVLGHGAIGRRVARILRAMDMEVRAVRRREPAAGDGDGDGGVHADGDAAAVPGSARRPRASDPDGRVVVAPDAAAVRRAAAGAHALVSCLPLTPETRGIVDGPLLDGLAEPAIVVNVGRGPVIDEAALHARLADGRIFGAGIDTWWRYPEDETARASTPPSDHAYGELDSVVLSPHRGGSERLEDERARRMAALAELLAALARGETGRGRLDPERGY